jgi:two-component system, response regulator PdtaR
MQKVLIVEDDFMVADCLEEILVDAGYEVCGITGEVAEAIELGKQHHPDLGVIDLRLTNGRYGTEVAAALCPGGGFGVLYATGNPDHPLLSHAEGEGCISKPYTATSVVSALRVVSERMSKCPVLSTFPLGFRLLRA